MSKDLSRLAIERQLKYLLSSPQFQSCRRLQNFLSFVVAETLADRGHRLKAYTIGIEVFNREATFDPQTDPIVRVQAMRLRRLLDDYYGQKTARDHIIIELPKGRYQPVFKTANQQPHLDKIPSVEPMAITAVQPPSLLVLSACGASAADDDIGFCDELADALTIRLMHYSALHIVSQQGNKETYQTNFVLKTKVRSTPDDVHIGAQLIEVASSRVLWAQSYNKQATTSAVPVIQQTASEIAATISGAHGVLQRFMRCHRDRTPSAYDPLLLFAAYCEAYSPQTHMQARAALEQTVPNAPNSAELQSALAVIYMAEHIFGFNRRFDKQPPLQRALKSAQLAVIANPYSVTGHLSLALAHYYLGESASFLSASQSCLRLAPEQADMLTAIGMHYAFAGQWSKGIAMLDKATALSSIYTGLHNIAYAVNDYRLGRYERALVAAHRINLPDFFGDYLIQAMIYGQLGHKKEAALAVKQLLALKPDIAHTAPLLLDSVFQNPELVAHCRSGLTKAGLPLNQAELALTSTDHAA